MFEFCEDAIKKQSAQLKRFYGPQVNFDSCAVSPTGVYKEGFPKEIIGGYPQKIGVGGFVNINQGIRNSRVLNIQLRRNPGNLPGILPIDDLGYYYIQDLDTDLDALPKQNWSFNIVYPVNNYAMHQHGGGRHHPLTTSIYQLYSGIWNAGITVEDRRPEIAEIYGEPACCNTDVIGTMFNPVIGNPTAGIKVINNPLDPDMEAMMDPDSMTFMTRIMDIYGNQLDSVLDYHKNIAYGPVGKRGLNDYSVIQPTRKIDLQLAGHVFGDMPKFQAYLHSTYPFNGLVNMTISLTDKGLSTNLSFSDRPPQAPQGEAILNKIGPRIM